MKKTFLLIASLCTLFFSANAQEKDTVREEEISDKGRWRFGITTGVGTSNINKADVRQNVESNVSVQLGATVDFFLTNNAYLESGILLQNKKVAYKIYGTPQTTITGNIDRLDLELPLTFNYKARLGKISLDPQVGGYFSFAPKGSSNKIITDANSSRSSSQDEKTDFGLRFGLGIQLCPLIRLSAAYDHGILDNGWGKSQNVTGGVTFFFK